MRSSLLLFVFITVAILTSLTFADHPELVSHPDPEADAKYGGTGHVTYTWEMVPDDPDEQGMDSDCKSAKDALKQALNQHMAAVNDLTASSIENMNCSDAKNTAKTRIGWKPVAETQQDDNSRTSVPQNNRPFTAAGTAPILTKYDNSSVPGPMVGISRGNQQSDVSASPRTDVPDLTKYDQTLPPTGQSGLAPRTQSQKFDPQIAYDPGTGGMSIGPSSLQPGDAILIGSSFSALAPYATSKAVGIQTALGQPVEHAMIVESVSADGNTVTVIEAVGGGVRRTVLADALNRSTQAVVFRDSSLTDGQRKAMVDFAVGKIGTAYDYSGAAGLATGQTGSADKMFCSDLVIQAYQQTGKFSSIDPKKLSPGDIAESQQLQYVGHLFAGTRYVKPSDGLDRYDIDHSAGIPGKE